MTNKEIFSIYRLNEIDFSNGEMRNLETIERKINEISQFYDPIELSLNTIWWLNIRLFHKTRSSQGIFGFISLLIPSWRHESIKRKYHAQSNHDLLFFYTENYIYWVSSWSWYKVFEPYIDGNFSSDILKRSLEPNFKAAETRSISWQTHWSDQVFRWLYRFDKSESFWKIFKKLAWKLKENSILKRYFTTDKAIGAIMKSNSIKVWSSLNIEELARLITTLEDIKNTPLTHQEQQNFKFIDSLRPVIIKEKKESIMKAFFNGKILPYLNSTTEVLDVEFCSPDNIGSFFCGNRYCLLMWSRVVDLDDCSIKTTLDKIKENNNFDELNLDDAFDRRKSYTLEVYGDWLWNDHPIKYKLLKCFHWEVCYQQENYFLIDGNVYKLNDNFRQLLREDIINFLADDTNILNNIPFMINNDTHINQREWLFNENHFNIDRFICCDRVCVSWIELFDLIYEDDEDVYIMHIKYWFDANMRDVCSQIEIWAKHIEEDIRDNLENPDCIVKLYNQVTNYTWDKPYRLLLKNYFSNVTLENFKAKFNKNRIYVIWLIVPNIITAWNIDTYNSNIARNELINTYNIFKQKYSWKLRIAFITPQE